MAMDCAHRMASFTTRHAMAGTQHGMNIRTYGDGGLDGSGCDGDGSGLHCGSVVSVVLCRCSCSC